MKIAIMGFGVVGSGVGEIIRNNQSVIKEKTGENIEVAHILDLRDFPDSEFKCFTKNFDDILNDKEVTAVVEVMGGCNPAYEFTKKLLKAGKHVVSSNKELVAKHGTELLKIARENNINYMFEASVGGGIPIIRPLCSCITAGEILGVYGILNGTTNYILTRMFTEGQTFEAALKEAQEKGYAEKDPTADVDGIDTCRKICILTGIATGTLPNAACVRTEGIREINREDVACLTAHGYAVKLLGRMQLTDGNPCCLVAPFACPTASPLAHVSDVFNGIAVRGATLGDTMFYGRGAGAAPTASAVVTDIIATLRDGTDSFAPAFTAATNATAVPSSYFTCRRYIRTALPKATLEKTLGELISLGDAYLTVRTFTESEFDAYMPALAPISTLRVL